MYVRLTVITSPNANSVGTDRNRSRLLMGAILNSALSLRFVRAINFRQLLTVIFKHTSTTVRL